jgi:ABC-type sulfate transport system, periplasmic component
MRKLLLFALILPVAFGCAGAAQAKRARTTLNLVAYSTPKPVLGKLIARFGHTAAGHGVPFSQSYGPSGSQARAIAAGQPTDVAFLSTGLDIDTVADAGIVSKSWTQTPYGGIAADSVVAFVVRPGNPKHIHGWKDLVKPGVQVVTPDPFPSGSAKWNVLAAYGAARKSGLNSKKAIQFVTRLFKNVVSQDSSGSNAANTFFSGRGDVLITYESEAYAAFAAGKQGKLVVPQPTMLIQLPMVTTKRSAGRGQGVHQVRARAKAAADLRRERLPPRRQVGAEAPRPRELAQEVHHRSDLQHPGQALRRLAEGRQGLVRSRRGPDGQDRAGGGRSHPLVPSPRRR